MNRKIEGQTERNTVSETDIQNRLLDKDRNTGLGNMIRKSEMIYIML